MCNPVFLFPTSEEVDVLEGTTSGDILIGFLNRLSIVRQQAPSSQDSGTTLATAVENARDWNEWLIKTEREIDI